MKLMKHAITALFALLLSMPAWAADSGPKAAIESTVTEIIHMLDVRADKTRLTPADREVISKTVEGKFGYAAMAKRSLGKPWNDLKKDEQVHFTAVFREHLERSYGDQLSKYKGQTVTFADAEMKGDKARVMSKVIDGSRETPVEYSLYQTATGWQVYDIRIEGSSMVRTFYQDFQSTLDKGGYPELLKTLEEKIAKHKEKD